MVTTRKDRIAAMWNAGAKYREMAEAEGICIATVRYYTKALPNRGPKWNATYARYKGMRVGKAGEVSPAVFAEVSRKMKDGETILACMSRIIAAGLQKPEER